MKSILCALVLAATVLPASAISRYNTDRMQCDEVQYRVEREGAAILRYKSRRTNMTLYDRYVAHGGYCERGKYAKLESVPAADTKRCPVLRCVDRRPFYLD